MANTTTAADIIDDMLFRAGEPTDGTSDFNATALQYLNRAHLGLCRGGAELDPTISEDWWWLRKSPPGKLTLEQSITTGTVNVTNNSTAITFSSAPAASVATWFFSVEAEADVYRISAHTAGAAAATLDSVFTGTTAPTATYKLFKLEYDIAADVLRIISPMRVYRADYDYEITGMDLLVLDRRWPLALIEEGIPSAFAQADEDTVRVNRYAGSATGLVRAEYDYLYRPSDLTDDASSIPAVPRQWRYVLADWGTFWLMLDKNDDRADAVGLAAKNGLKAMAMENRHKLGSVGGGAFGQIRPRQDEVRRATGPLRTSSGLIIG